MTDYLIPQWPAPARVRALCTTRTGGTSGAPYDSFNLGEHVGDDPQAVAMAAMTAEPAAIRTLRRSMSREPTEVACR